MVEKFSKYIREKPLESGCWCYFLLTIIPGVCWRVENAYAAEAVFRYLLPGSAAFAISVHFYGASTSALGLKGGGKSLLCCCPLAVLCLANLILAGTPESIRPEHLFWLFSCALGEEIMGRMLLLSSISTEAYGRGWGNPTVIALSAVFFGMMHAVNYAAQGTVGTIFQCCYTAGIGALLAWSYQKSGCLWGGVLWHALLNLTGVSFR